MEAPQRESSFKFRFDSCGTLAPPVLAFYKVGFSYSGKMDQGCLFKDLDLAVNLDTRVAIVGPNGAGKSTLMKLMSGDLQPVEGRISRHLDLRMARYHQHTVEIVSFSFYSHILSLYLHVRLCLALLVSDSLVWLLFFFTLKT